MQIRHMTRARSHDHVYTLDPASKSFAILPKQHIVFVFIWCKSETTSDLYSPLLQMQSGSNQALNTPLFQTTIISPWCQGCHGGQGGTVSIEERIEHICVVLRHSNRPFVEQGRLRSMTYVCVQPRTLRSEPRRSVLSLSASNAQHQNFWFDRPSWLGSSFPEQPNTLLTR